MYMSKCQSKLQKDFCTHKILVSRISIRLMMDEFIESLFGQNVWSTIYANKHAIVMSYTM